MKERLDTLTKAPPYFASRVVAGAASSIWSGYVVVATGSAIGFVAAVALFTVGWLGARRFAKPAGDAKTPSWVDTAVPIVIALAATLPLVFGLLVIDTRDALPAALGAVAALLAGFLLSLATGPYRNEKVALSLEK